MIILEKFLKSIRANAAIEFALAMPILLLLAVGGFELTRFIIIQQKLSKTVNTMGNLIAQSPSLTEEDLANMWPAVDNLMDPYSSDANQIVIVSDVSNNGSNNIVNWQRSGGGSYAGVSKIGSSGGAAALPGGFTLATNEDTIVSEIYYKYTPLIGPNVIVGGAQVLYKVKYYKPRLGALSVINP